MVDLMYESESESEYKKFVYFTAITFDIVILIFA